MAVPKDIQYLNFLSDFWVTYYADAPVLDHALGAVAEILKSYYFNFLQKAVPLAVQDLPIFAEGYWNIIELFADEATIVEINSERYFKYSLDETYAHIPMLYNIVYQPTLILKENQDYIFQVVLSPTSTAAQDTSITIRSSILFKEKLITESNPYNGDPFSNNDIAKRVVSGNRVSITLFAPKVFIDQGDLYKEYGTLLNIKAASSPEYKNFLHGLLYLYLKGPSVAALNAGINLAGGYPVARQTEVIRSVEIVIDHSQDINEFSLISDVGNVYTIPRKVLKDYNEVTNSTFDVVFPLLKLSNRTYYDLDNKVDVTNANFADPLLAAGVYPVYYEVDRLDTFLDNLKIVDNQTEPNWWRIQLGTMSREMAPELTDIQRRDPVIQEFLFQRFFKYNTFGVFVDLRVLRQEFQLINEFFDIIKQVKPTFKSFIIYENDLKVITIVHSGNTATDLGLLDVNGNFTPEFSNGVHFGYTFGVEDIIGTDPEVFMALPYLDERGYQRGADPVRIGMALETVGSSYDIPKIGFDLLSTPNSGARSFYNIGKGYPIVVGIDNEGSTLEIGMLPHEQVTEFPSLIRTEAPQLSPLSFTGKGPYLINISWSVVPGATEYVVLRDGEPVIYTSSHFTTDRANSLSHLYEVVAVFSGFLSKSSLGFAILPPNAVILYYLQEGIGVNLTDLSEFQNRGQIQTLALVPDLLIPIFLYELLEESGVTIGDASGHLQTASILTAPFVDDRLFVYLQSSDAGGVVVHNMVNSTLDAAILIEPLVEHYRYNYTFQSSNLLDSSTTANNASLTTGYLTSPFTFRYTFATRDVPYLTDSIGLNSASKVTGVAISPFTFQYNFSTPNVDYLTDLNGLNLANKVIGTPIVSFVVHYAFGSTTWDSTDGLSSVASLGQINPLPNQANLQAAYLFNKTILDSSSQGNHVISLNGGASVNESALYLKDSSPSDFAELPVNVLNGLSSFSITTWVKINITTVFKFHSIVTGTSSTSASAIVLYVVNRKVVLVIAEVEYTFPTETYLDDGTYHHLAVTVTGSSASLYVDGLFKSAVPVSFSSLIVDSSVFLGIDFQSGSLNPNHCLSGYLDNLFIYNIELDAAGVTAAMNYTRT